MKLLHQLFQNQCPNYRRMGVCHTKKQEKPLNMCQLQPKPSILKQRSWKSETTMKNSGQRKSIKFLVPENSIKSQQPNYNKRIKSHFMPYLNQNTLADLIQEDRKRPMQSEDAPIQSSLYKSQSLKCLNIETNPRIQIIKELAHSNSPSIICQIKKKIPSLKSIQDSTIMRRRNKYNNKKME